MGIVQRRNTGFTVIELLVVVAVIGILASIVMVVYPNYLKQTYDSQRKSDLEQISAALRAYAIKNNDYMESGSGCGFGGEGNGWVNAGPDAFFPKSIMTCLEEANLLGEAFADPSGCVSDTGGECGASGADPTTAYMKATCEKDGNPVTYLFAHLETEPRKDSEVDGLCDAGTVAGFTSTSQLWGSRYGMNYYIAVQ